MTHSQKAARNGSCNPPTHDKKLPENQTRTDESICKRNALNLTFSPQATRKHVSLPIEVLKGGIEIGEAT